MSNLVVRKLILYRNGDPSFKPINFLYNSNRIRTYEKFLEELDRKVPPIRGGAVKNLYTLDGKKKIETKEQLEGDGEDLVLVVGGPEPYRRIRGGYENIGIRRNGRRGSQPPDDEELTASEPRNQRRPYESQISRADSGVKKFTIVRSGDSSFPPKPYTLRMKYVKSFDQLVEDIERFAPPIDGGIARLYTLKGEEVNGFDDISTGKTYAIAGENGFIEPRGGFPGHAVATLDSSALRRSRSTDSIYSARSTGKGIGSPRNSSRGNSPRRPPSERLQNRPDQYQARGAMIFLFRNGRGLDSKIMRFTEHQMDRGWPWFLEQCAQPFGVSPRVLRAMDGKEVNHVDQLKWKGAYVLVPHGEKFRDDSWYYLPTGATDTSEEADLGSYDGEGRERPKTRARPLKDRPGDGGGGEDYEDEEGGDDRTESARNSPNHDDAGDYGNHGGGNYDSYNNESHENRPSSPHSTSKSSSSAADDRQSKSPSSTSSSAILRKKTKTNRSRPHRSRTDSYDGSSRPSSYYGKDREEEEEEDEDGDDGQRSRRGSETLDEEEEDWAASKRREHQSRHGYRSRAESGHGENSPCSSCERLEKQLKRHRISTRHAKRRPNSAGAQTSSNNDNRSERVKENVRSISPSPNRRKSRAVQPTAATRTGRKSIVSRKSSNVGQQHRRDSRLAASYPSRRQSQQSSDHESNADENYRPRSNRDDLSNQDEKSENDNQSRPASDRRSRSRSQSRDVPTSSASSRRSELSRTRSDAGLFYARDNRQRKSNSGDQYKIRRDESSPFGSTRYLREKSAYSRPVRDDNSTIPRSQAHGDPKLRRERSKTSSNWNY